MGQVKDSNYDGNCTSRHLRFGTWKIACRLIFLGGRVYKHNFLSSSRRYCRICDRQWFRHWKNIHSICLEWLAHNHIMTLSVSSLAFSPNEYPLILPLSRNVATHRLHCLLPFVDSVCGVISRCPVCNWVRCDLHRVCMCLFWVGPRSPARMVLTLFAYAKWCLYFTISLHCETLLREVNNNAIHSADINTKGYLCYELKRH